MNTMARPRVEPETIREVLTLLEAEGKPVSVTAIRQRLGSGSYSTIGAVLSAWRREQAAAVLPAVAAIPERVTHLVQNLWAEACKAATNVHDGVRVALDQIHAISRPVCWTAALR